tara:strand:- start:5466 stop:6044 length:579 start_codon:yes stop_codon:yes gene_type:complete
MAIAINGSGTVTGISVGGLPDGCVDTDTLATSVTRGKILQVVSTTKTDTTSVDVGSGNAYDFTAFNVAITPTSTSNKVLVLATVSVGWNSTMPFFMNLQVNGSVCTDAVGDAAGNRNRSSMGGFQGHTGGIETVNLSFVHSPASTSTQTYNIAFRHDSSQTKTLNVNRSSGDSDSSQNGRFASSLIAMEVAA